MSLTYAHARTHARSELTAHANAIYVYARVRRLRSLTSPHITFVNYDDALYAHRILISVGVTVQFIRVQHTRRLIDKQL